MGGFLLCWNSGHKPPRPVYYHETEEGWGATYDRQSAKVFSSREKARRRWAEVHSYPEDAIYQDAWAKGRIRVEPTRQPALWCAA